MNVSFHCSAEGMKAGNYGNLLVQIEQPRGEYAVTIAFLRLLTTLVKVVTACSLSSSRFSLCALTAIVSSCLDVQGQLGSTQNKGLIPCVLLVLKEMLPTYHKWRYNTYGVQERIGEPSVQPRCWHFIMSKGSKPQIEWIPLCRLSYFGADSCHPQPESRGRRSGKVSAALFVCS